MDYATYWNEKDGWIYTIEIFKGKRPVLTKRGRTGGLLWILYLCDEKSFSGAAVCRLMKVDWRKDSAPRFLWKYLNKMAEESGVEKLGVTYENSMEGHARTRKHSRVSQKNR